MAHVDHDYDPDSCPFDLTCTHVDALGIEWSWTGGWAAGDSSEPLMQSGDRNQYSHYTPVPLSDVHRDHGPLIAVQRRTYSEEQRAVRAGFVTDSGPSTYYLRGGTA